MLLLALFASAFCFTAARIGVDVEDISLTQGPDCKAVADLRSALAAGGSELEKRHSLNYGRCGFDPVDAQLVADVLRHPHGRLDTLVLDGRRIPASDLALMLNASDARKTLETLKIHSCQLGSAGGVALLDFFKAVDSTKLKFIDFQDNDIGFGVCQDLLDGGDKLSVQLNLDGNPLVSEIGNAVTHGIGEILALVGTVMMAKRMEGKPAHYKWSLMAYCVSLDLMFLMSVFHHSFFGLGITVTHIFFVLDTSAVFLVILGTFTPLLAILFHGKTWAKVLHGIMAFSAVFGIVVNFFQADWVPYVRMPLFMAMGWSAVLCLYPIALRIGKSGAWLLLGGGVFYTVGVLFDVRRRWFLAIPDHTTWHVFVVCGAMVHYQLIYQQVATYEYDLPLSEPKEPLVQALAASELSSASSSKLDIAEPELSSVTSPPLEASASNASGFLSIR